MTKRELFSRMIVCGVLLAGGVAHAGGGKHVDLKAADGTPLKATYYAASKPGPAIVLLHMCNSQRKAWATLGPKLAAKGLHAIALDYRGYGDSGGKRQTEWTPDERVKMNNEVWPSDIDAAFKFLASRPGVDRTRVGAAGGSCGVNQAIQFARRHPEVKTLVLLAGGTTRPGEEYLEKASWMPILGVAAHDDGDAVGIMGWVMGFSSNPTNQLKTYPKGGHGTDLFPVHADLEPTIVAWFERHLVTSPVRVVADTQPKPGPSATLGAELRKPGAGERLRQKLRQARKTGAKASLPPEGVVNILGYEMMQSGRVQDAIGLLTLNVEAHPDSANTYDSLSDAYVAAKDPAKAAEYARKALDALPRDKKAGEDLKKQIRESCAAKLKQK